MDELLPPPDDEADDGEPLPEGANPSRDGRPRRAPYVRLLAYYAAIGVSAGVLVVNVPLVRQAFVTEIELPATGAADALTGRVADGADGRVLGVAGIVDRAVTVALVVLGALVLVVPVTWIYMYTRPSQYDPSLVHSILILPVVVASVVVIVKNSLALAFSLAGIVAAVRFRTTIKDLKDAVYIFLAIGIGLAAGVQALDVAMVMSMGFSLLVLTLWKYDLTRASTGRPDRTSVLTIGDPALLVAGTPARRREIRTRLAEARDGMRTDGILLVHTADLGAARQAVELSLRDRAKEWRFAPPEPGNDGCSTLPVLVWLKARKGDPRRILGDLEERFHHQVPAAEFIPFQTATNEGAGEATR